MPRSEEPLGLWATPWLRAGLVAGMFSGAPSAAWALSRGEDVLASTEAVGATVLRGGGGRLGRLVAGGLAHVAISLLWARVLRRPLQDRPDPAGAAAAGALWGAAIAGLDLGLIGRRLPAIRSLEVGPLFADHVAYGAIVGWVLARSG